MKKLTNILLTIVLALTLVGCASDADVASVNVSRAADNFEVTRRIVFYNGITGDYILVIDGLCSLGKLPTRPVNYRLFVKSVQPATRNIFSVYPIMLLILPNKLMRLMLMFIIIG